MADMLAYERLKRLGLPVPEAPAAPRNVDPDAIARILAGDRGSMGSTFAAQGLPQTDPATGLPMAGAPPRVDEGFHAPSLPQMGLVERHRVPDAAPPPADSGIDPAIGRPALGVDPAIPMSRQRDPQTGFTPEELMSLTPPRVGEGFHPDAMPPKESPPPGTAEAGTPPRAGLTPPTEVVPAGSPRAAAQRGLADMAAGREPGIDPMSPDAFDPETGLRSDETRKVGFLKRLVGPDADPILGRALLAAGAAIMGTEGHFGVALSNGIKAGLLTYDDATTALREEEKEARKMGMVEEAHELDMELKRLQLERRRAGPVAKVAPLSPIQDVQRNAAQMAALLGVPEDKAIQWALHEAGFRDRSAASALAGLNE